MNKVAVGNRYKLNSDRFGTIVAIYKRNGLVHIVMSVDYDYMDNNVFDYNEKEFEKVKDKFYDIDSRYEFLRGI